VTTFVRERSRCDGSNDFGRQTASVAEYSVRAVRHFREAQAVQAHAIDNFHVDKRDGIAAAGWRRFVGQDFHWIGLRLGWSIAPGCSAGRAECLRSQASRSVIVGWPG
jgi:hypothetical protein